MQIPQVIVGEAVGDEKNSPLVSKNLHITLHRALVKEVTLSYHIKETVLSTMDPCYYGNYLTKINKGPVHPRRRAVEPSQEGVPGTVLCRPFRLPGILL